MGTRKRPYRREIRYPDGLRIGLTTAMREALEAEAEAADTSAAAVARDALERGLPLVRDARRKRARSNARSIARSTPVQEPAL